MRSDPHPAETNDRWRSHGVAWRACTQGGLAVIGGLNLGGSIEIVHNPLDLVELAIERGSTAVLMPVSCRRALVDLSDEAAAKIQTIFYLDPGDALRKALHDG